MYIAVFTTWHQYQTWAEMMMLFFSSSALSTIHFAISASCCATCFASTAPVNCGLKAKCVCDYTCVCQCVSVSVYMSYTSSLRPYTLVA